MQLKWRLAHIRGYLELGMLKEAAAELQLIPASAADDEEVLTVQVAFLQEAREWAHMAQVARELVRRRPDEPAWWVAWAYAVRRAESLTSARVVLAEAETRHPGDATIQFNLGCYACQLGEFEEARRRVERAQALDPHFAEAARTDPDLEPLRTPPPVEPGR